MSDSILDSVKKVLGIEPDYTVFDPDIIMHINSALSTLHQLGIGPDAGFTIADKEATWSQFLAEDDPHQFNSVRTYVYLRVRILFDPPGTSYLISSLERQLKEFEWRLNVRREETDYVDPIEEEV